MIAEFQSLGIVGSAMSDSRVLALNHSTPQAAPLVITAGRAANFNRLLAVGSGLTSFAFGLLLVYQIGIVDGLFSATPNWIPH